MDMRQAGADIYASFMAKDIKTCPFPVENVRLFANFSYGGGAIATPTQLVTNIDAALKKQIYVCQIPSNASTEEMDTFLQEKSKPKCLTFRWAAAPKSPAKTKAVIVIYASEDDANKAVRDLDRATFGQVKIEAKPMCQAYD